MQINIKLKYNSYSYNIYIYIAKYTSSTLFNAKEKWFFIISDHLKRTVIVNLTDFYLDTYFLFKAEN